MGYKWCIVPQCTNTSIKTPNKLFVAVPQHFNVRRKWLRLARRNPDDIGTRTSVFCCEDHFDIERDMANYMKYKMGFSERKLLKNGVLPSKFDCQEDCRKSLGAATISRPAYKQRKKLDITQKYEEGGTLLKNQNGNNLESTTENRSNFAFVDCSKSVPEFAYTLVKSEPIYDFNDVSDNFYAANCNIEIKHEDEIEIEETRVKNELCDSTYDDSCALIVATNSSTSKRTIEEKNSAVENVGVKPSRYYTCTVCDYKTTSSYYFKMHMQTHTRTKEIRPHKCSMCQYAGLTARKLKEHMKTHPEEKLFKCNLCEYATTNYTNFMLHVSNRCALIVPTNSSTSERRIEEKNSAVENVGVKPVRYYRCSVCEYKTTSSYNVKMHMQIHTRTKEIRPYKCSMCQYAGITALKLKEHMKTHPQETLLKCNLCEYSTTNYTNLTLHMKVHTAERTHKCIICSYAATKPYHLKMHMRTHTGRNPYECNKCKYVGETKRTRNEHMKTHRQAKHYTCGLCPYATTNSRNFKCHMNIHIGEIRVDDENSAVEIADVETSQKCYTCNVCEYTTTTSNKLKMHMSTHAGEKLFNCTICQCAGLSKVKLREHMKLHTGVTLSKCSLSDNTAAHFTTVKFHMRKDTGENLHACAMCEGGFAQPSDLKRHIMRMHII